MAHQEYRNRELVKRPSQHEIDILQLECRSRLSVKRLSFPILLIKNGLSPTSLIERDDRYSLLRDEFERSTVPSEVVAESMKE